MSKETKYDPEPKTLDALICQCNEWDGKVLRIEPQFDDDGVFRTVGIWIEPFRERGELDVGEWEQVWRRTHCGWTLAGDGAGDPATSGGSVLTGRDLG